MAFPNDNMSATPAKYLFKLESETETVICNPEPLEWHSGTIKMNRDIDAGGVFSSYTAESLTFVGNGAEMLRKLYEAYELNAKCTLRIYWYKKTTRTYIEFPSTYDINFNLYQRVKVGKFVFGVKIKAVNSSVQTKFDSRWDIDVNVNNTTSIGGVAIPGISNAVKGLRYNAVDVNYAAVLKSDFFSEFDLPHIADTPTYTSIPFDILSSDFPGEVQPVPYLALSPLHSITPFFNNALSVHSSVEIYYRIRFQVTDRYVGEHPWQFQLVQTTSAGVDTVLIDGGFGGEVQIYTFEGTEVVSLAKGDSLRFVVYLDGIDAHYIAHVETADITITEPVVSSPATTTEGLPVYDALETLARNVLDTDYPLYSEFFGRTDKYYLPGVPYATENQLRFAHIQSGLNQRGVAVNDTESPLSMNLKKLIETLKCIYNIGYSLETIGGTTRLRIEDYAHFFQNVEVLDLSSRLTRYDIESIVMPELVPVELKCGFESYEYLTVNGRAEANTASSRTSIMNTATKWNNISPYRADTKGIFDNLSSPVETDGSKDTKGDSSIFIVKSQTDPTYGWKAETNENIEVDQNTSVFKDGVLNRMFTPSRMLVRHGNRLRAGLSKFTASVLKFQSSDKQSGLKTIGDSGSGVDYYTITENQDITVSNLPAPLYKAIKHTVDVKFFMSDLELITANPFGYITLSDTISGYLLTLEKQNDEDSAKITLIEKA